MAGGGGEEGEFGLQIAPLLDVLFVLHLFFMVNAGTKQQDQPVIIAPAPEAQHQRVIDLLAACNKAKVKNLAFGAAR